MTETRAVLLFDMDGVLVAPLGYRHAVVATVLHFAHRLGLEPPPPADADMAEYEAHGITSEWDMVPLMLAALLEAAAARGWPLPAAWPPVGAAPVPRARRFVVPQVDYRAPAARVAATLPDAAFPAAHAARLQQGPNPPFPRLAARPDLTAALFAHSRDTRRSPITRAFQHYVLGSETFARTYGQGPDFPTASYLLAHDRPLPAAPWRDGLYRAWQAGRVALAVMTARPSRPHPDAVGYAPEAEMALQRIGWPAAPHIGYGHVRAATADGEGYLKPHPAHALAALHAALTRDATASLPWALAVLATPARARALLPPRLALTVVEDSPPGLRAAQAAAAVLRAAGVPVDLNLVGVAAHPAKRQALAALGARVASSLDAAVAQGWLPRYTTEEHGANADLHG